MMLPILASVVAAAPGLAEQDLWVGGAGGYHTYRIPAIITTPRGVVLAFCEGRVRGRSDSGEIHLLMRRSLDGGMAWEPSRVISAAAGYTTGNPCPVVDRDSGTVTLLLTRNLASETESEILSGTSEETRSVWMTRSEDDGATWTEPADITATTKAPGWTWYATGPGVGIQAGSGRLIVPCDHALAGSNLYESHVIISDDGGLTWCLGGTVTPKVNECQVVELSGGRLMLNMRNYDGRHRRAVALSDDGGLTWTRPLVDEALVEPVCQASLIRCADGALLFANPASQQRVRMTVRLSRDDGRTWPAKRVLHDGPSAYSCLTELRDETVGCLYERGDRDPYERLTLARFTVGWIADGA